MALSATARAAHGFWARLSPSAIVDEPVCGIDCVRHLPELLCQDWLASSNLDDPDVISTGGPFDDR